MRANVAPHDLVCFVRVRAEWKCLEVVDVELRIAQAQHFFPQRFVSLVARAMASFSRLDAQLAKSDKDAFALVQEIHVQGIEGWRNEADIDLGGPHRDQLFLRLRPARLGINPVRRHRRGRPDHDDGLRRIQFLQDDGLEFLAANEFRIPLDGVFGALQIPRQRFG